MIRVGARASPLSRAQVAEIAAHLPIDPLFIDTTGDLDKTTSLRTLDKTDFFTRELDQLLLSHRIDAAIHSAKDLPDPLPPGLALAALTAGVDPRDSLVYRALPPAPLIATSSERREHAVRQLLPDARFTDLRGTIHERLAQLTPPLDGLVVAEAALVRLGLTHLPRLFLPTHPLHQGRLAILTRANDPIAAHFAPLHATTRPWTILYLGLNPTACPSRGRIYHYPVIRTIPLPHNLPALWPHFTHVLFTSQSALHHLPPLPPKPAIAIGPSTAAAIRALWHTEPLIAPFATQEGVLALLQTLPSARILWPRSRLSRSLLEPHTHPVDLYDTIPQQPGFPPPLADIDEIFFSSPSSIRAFLTIYGTLPRDKKLSVQGPVTIKELERIKREEDSSRALLAGCNYVAEQ